MYSTFTGWENAGDSKKIAPVLEEFGRYCEPQKNTPFERYRFNRRCQDAGESYDQYRTALRKLAANCDFGSITPDELLRDRLVFGVRDSKIRERLLREPALTLKRTDEICRSAESTVSQLKLVEDGQGASINAVTTPRATCRNTAPVSGHHRSGTCSTAPTVASNMTPGGESRARHWGRPAESVGNETILRSSVEARGETPEHMLWTRAGNRIQTRLVKPLYFNYLSTACTTHNSLHSA